MPDRSAAGSSSPESPLATPQAFADYVVSVNPDGPCGSHQTKYRFPNGYGASVIRGGFTAYGGYELAVLKWTGDKSPLTYDTPVTSDVEGHLDDERCADLLTQIKALPAHDAENIGDAGAHDATSEQVGQ